VRVARLRLGDLDQAAGQVPAARTHFQAYLDAAAALTGLDPDNPAYQATTRGPSGSSLKQPGKAIWR
jgi:outer membrane protein TolC